MTSPQPGYVANINDFIFTLITTKFGKMVNQYVLPHLVVDDVISTTSPPEKSMDLTPFL